MTDDYNLAKPDPTSGHLPPKPPPYMVDVNLPPNDVVMGDPAVLAPGERSLADRIEEQRQRADASGFQPGQDRMHPHIPQHEMEAARPGVYRAFVERDVWQENAILRAEVARLRQDALNRALAERPVVTEYTSDGYHTFRELYDHRRALTAALMVAWEEAFPSEAPGVWRSRAHHPLDSEIYPGYFIVGIDLPTGTVTYHYANQFWDDFKNVPEREHAPRWDGAPPESSVTRLLDFARR